MSKRGIDGDLVGIDDVTVVDPDLPAWHIIQRTTHQGRTYKVYHGPLGEYAESKKQAILLSSGVPLSAAMLAPKTRPAPGVRLVDAKSAASHQGSPARAPRAVSPLLAYDGGGASPLLDPVDDEPNPGSQALRTAKTRFKELNDSCVDCVVRVPTSEIVDESSALYLTAATAATATATATARWRGGRRRGRGEAAAARGGRSGGRRRRRRGRRRWRCSRGGHEQRRCHRGGGGGDERRGRAAGAAGGARGGVGRAGQPPPR